MEHGSKIDPGLVAHVRHVHLVAAVALVAMSSAVLANWLFAAPPASGLTTMSPWQMRFNTALGLWLAGIALFALLPGAGRRWQHLVRTVGILIVLLGAVSFLQDLFDWQLGIDEFFVPGLRSSLSGSPPGRMPANTAFSFVMAGAAMIVADRRTASGRRPAEWLAMISTLPPFLALIGYVFQLQQSAGLFSTTAMSVHAAFGFWLLAVGLLSARPTDGGMHWLVTRAPEGTAARLLLPGSLGLLVAVGAIASLGRELGLYSVETGNALLFVLGIGALFFLLTRAIARLARVEDKRRAALDTLQRREEKLRFVTDAAEIGEWDWDIRSNRLDWSEHCRAIFGLGKNFPVDHRKFIQMIHPDDRARVEARVGEALRTRGTYDVEFRILRPDGSERWMHSKGRATFAADGQPSRMGGIVIDITQHKLAEAELQRERLHLRAIIDNASALIAIRDLQSNLVLANRRLFALPGMAAPEQVLGRKLDECLPPAIARLLNAETAPGEAGNARARTERVLHHLDGTSRTYLIDSFPVLDELTDQCFGICTISTDVSDLKRLEEALRVSEQRFRKLADEAPAMLWVVDTKGADSFVSRGWYEFAGQDQPLADDPCSILTAVHPDDQERVAAQFHESFASHRDFECEFRARHGDGRYRWLLNRGRARFDADGEYAGFVGSLIDITARKEAEEHIRKTALHDPLTGLPNRALIFEYGGHALAARLRAKGQAALLFIDLDRFKPINDTFGHEAGDHVLKEVARRLTQCTRKADLVGRLGGDEFVILLSQMSHGSERDIIVARHVQETISEPISYYGALLDVTPSIGISRFPEHGADIGTLLHCADAAMYQAKQSGRANYHLYTHDLNRRAEIALMLESRLRSALRNNALALHYQPVVETCSGRVTAAEALVRLADDGPAVSPGEFIPVAEAAGLINEIGDWVAVEACRQQREWQQAGLAPLTVAINVSPLQFRQRGFARRIGDIVAGAGIDPRLLQLEVTESTVMEEVDDAIAILESIKAQGIGVALDDFGTGHSSLSLLGTLPLDKIKIDQEFIKRVERDQCSLAVTQAIIALAHTLHLELVGEGVESAEAYAYLRDSGCQQAQGYFISPPMSAGDFRDWRRLH